MNTLRPTWGETMINELAEIMAVKINRWCNDETDLDDCREVGKKVFRHSYNDDGYELAKDFEREGFSPDLELVEILDCASYEGTEILRNHIKEWVKSENIKADLSIGDNVRFLRGRTPVFGEIVKLYEDTAMYGIYVESEGHIKGQSCTLIDFEKVTKIIPEPQIVSTP